MRDAGSRPLLPAAAAWLAVLLVISGLHPALVGAGPFPEMADDLGRVARRSVERLLLLGEIDRGTIPAVFALVLALLYASGYLTLRLSPPAAGQGSALRPDPRGLAGAAFAGHLGGWIVAEMGGKAAAVQASTLAIALLVAIGRRRGTPRPAGRPRPAARRSIELFATAIVFVLMLRPIDIVATFWLRSPQFPELWYVLVPALIAPDALTAPLVGLVLATLPAAVLLGEGGEEEGFARDALLAAPAWALLLGPSHPFQALGVAFALARMRRTGMHALFRIAFVLAVVGLPVLGAFLIPG